MAKPTWITQPWMGLWLDTPSWQGDPRAFSACNNVRITLGRVTSALMGWTDLGITLNGPVTLIADFPANNNHRLVLGTPTDLYDWHNGTPVYLTPSYAVGTVVSPGGSPVVTGTGTLWKTKMGTLRIRDNVMPGDQITFGSAVANSLGSTWLTVLTVDSDTQITLTTNAPLSAGSAYTIRQLAQGDAEDYRWHSELFPAAGPPLNADAMFISNGLDPVITWDGSDLFAKYQADMPFLARYMRRYKNLMIYSGITFEGEVMPTAIANSDNGLPLELAEGIANQFIVSDGPYQINHLGVLGNNLMIYMGTIDDGSVVAASLVGGLTTFVFTEVIRGRGPISGDLVMEFPDRHEFISTDGQYRYNGLYTQIMNQHVWRAVLQNFDRARAGRAYTHWVPQYGLFHIAIPLLSDELDEVETAYIENYLEQPSQILFKPITQRDFPFTACGQLPLNSTLEYWNLDPDTWDVDVHHWNDNTITGAYAAQFAGDAEGKLYTLFTAETQAASFAVFCQRIVAGERSRGLVRRIYPFAEFSGGGWDLIVTLFLYDQIGGPLAITDPRLLNLTYNGNRFTSHFRRGRVAEVMFSTPGPDQPWTLTGWDWDVGGTLAGTGGLR